MTEEHKFFVPSDTLANRLRLLRYELGLTHREAEIRTGVGRGSWQSWKSGRSPRNALRDLVKVAEALKVDRDWLLFGGPLRAETPQRGSGSGTADDGLAFAPFIVDHEGFGWWHLPRRSGPESAGSDLDSSERSIAGDRKAELLALRKAIPRNPERIKR